MRKLIFLFLILNSPGLTFGQRIDRKAVVERHTISQSQFDSLSSLSLGNGRFCFTADITGLQTFPEAYANGVPLGTQSEWGWHSFPNVNNYAFDETLKNYFLNGRNVSYSVQLKEPERSRDAVNWFRQNPHRLQLGAIGFEILKSDGSNVKISDIKNISQQLNLYKGELQSHFEIEGTPVDVITYCHQQDDIIAVKVKSVLIGQKRLQLVISFPYPTGEWKDVGINYSNADKHRTSLKIVSSENALFHRQLDSTRYFVEYISANPVSVIKASSHRYIIEGAKGSNEFSSIFHFRSVRATRQLSNFDLVAQNNKVYWEKFWKSGAAVDFAGSTDTRAHELERRVILSQYLTKIQCAGNYPPQETGLTYNSWFGKPHLEMHWWHAVHFALWGRKEMLEKQMDWYKKVAAPAYAIAKRQGYSGLRWQKMTDHEGNESPSSVGAFLIWQQPHFITFAELIYKQDSSLQTLNKYKDLVFATADFMSSYAYYDSALQRYILGKGVIAAQERFKAEETFNPAYELVYWYWALSTAQQWRTRLKMKPDAQWEQVIKKLSPLIVQDGRYLFAESATDSYTNPEYKTDHPSVLGSMGMLPKTALVNHSKMQNTFNWIWSGWNWKDTWGWDFPMTAMTATRLGLREKAVDALLMPVQTNTYLRNGHNYQDSRLTIYLPGNGGLLTAVALMCAGGEDSSQSNPGFPSNGKWKVKWEGFKKFF